MSNELRIEKSRLPVVLVTATGDRISGDLFVQACARNRLGYESAPDILNAPEPFFPLATLDGATRLIGKAHVRELIVAPEDVEQPVWDFGTRAHVRMHLADGEVRSGDILIELESSRSRVLDFLNSNSDRFLTLYNDHGVVLLNRAGVVWVEEDERS
jgi:hypothetical protein